MSGFNAVSATNTEKAAQGFGPSSQSVAFSHYSNLSAQLPIDPATGKIVAGDVAAQAAQCFKNIEAVAKAVDHTMNDIVRITVFVTDIFDLDAVDRVYKSFFPTYLPTRTVVAVDALPMDALVQIDAQLTHGVGTIPNAPQAGDLVKLTNNTVKAPICPLSNQNVAFSHYTNITTQLPLDPKSGRIVEGGVEAQAARCLQNIKNVLESIDVVIDDVVKMTVFLTDLADMEAVDNVYRTFFPDSAIARAVAYVPARTVLKAKALPLGALVQMEAVVSYGDGTPPQLVEDRHGIIIEAVNTDAAPQDDLATQSVAFSHYNHISGQLPVDVKTGKVVDGGVAAQTECCLNYIKAILENIDHGLEDVVKVNLYLADLADMDAVDEAYGKFFPDGTPARRVVGVGALPQGALIQIDAIAGNTEGTPPVK